MAFGIDRRARTRKARGLFRRSPDAREVGERLSRLIKRVAKGAVRRAGWKQDRFVAELELHPAAPVVTVSIEPDAELLVRGETVGIGPGYHASIAARLAPLLDELDYVWTGEESDIERAMCAWIAGELAGEGQVRLGLPKGRIFHSDAPVLTVLGPRDAAWRAAVLADPTRAIDALAWRAAGDEAYSRALLAMWHEVPWREPLDAQERELMETVDADLRAAQRGGRDDLPWPDWAELLAHLDADAEHVEAVCARAAGRAATIGYRRLDLDVELSGGWTVRLPGSFAGAWEDEGARYWGTDGDRAIEFTSVTAEAEADSERLLAVAPEQHPVIDRFVEGARHGRAEAYEQDDVHVVVGLVACAPHVAILTCKGGPSDRAWALATWRSLRQG